MPKSMETVSSLSIRIDLVDGRIGPGKIELLETICSCGSIRAASQTMGMSYRRAWDLVDEVNRLCATPAVELKVGGKNGGGASLTPLGTSLVARYHQIIHRAESVAIRSFLPCGRRLPLRSINNCSKENVKGSFAMPKSMETVPSLSIRTTC